MNPSLPTGSDVLARLAEEPRFAASYQLEHAIGHGGMALVVRATARATRRPVAVKILAGPWTPQVAERFVREGRLMAQVRHPNVLQVFDLGLIGATPYLVTELAPEGSLRDEILRHGPLEIARISELMAPVLDALATLHDRGIIHRDLKPDNILIGADGAPRVADFGLALASNDHRITATGAFVGSVAYAAPEMLLGDPPAASVDLYAIGCILYELIAGSPPFTARTTAALIARIMQDPPPPLDDVAPDLAPEITRTIFACLAKRPEERPSSAAELAAGVARWPALNAAPRGTRRTRPMPVVAKPPAALSQASRHAKRRVGYASALTALTVAALALCVNPERPVPAPSASASPHAALAAELARHCEQGLRYLRQFNDQVAKSAMLAAEATGSDYPAIARRVHASREELRAAAGPLRSRAGPQSSRAERALLARADAGEITYWWVEEHVRGSLLPWNEPHLDEPARRADVEGLALHLSFQEHALAVLAGAPEPAELHGELLAALLEDIRSVSRSATMHTWGPDTLPRRKAASAAFTRQLAALGPLGGAALSCWTWGAEGTFKKTSRPEALAAVAALRKLATEVTGGGEAVARLADRMERGTR